MKDSPVTDNNDLASFGYRQELKRAQKVKFIFM